MSMPTLADVPARRAGQFLTPQMLALFAVMASLPLWIRPIGLYDYLGVEVAIWMIYALGFNLLFGYGGLHSFGHGAYFGVGGYAFGLVQLNVAESVWLGLLGAAGAAAIAGAVVALFVSHRRGIYFALMTIAFGQVFWFVAIKWHTVTGGEDGLLNIPRPPIDFGVVSFALTDNRSFYIFVLVALALAVVLMWRIVNSPFGRVLQAIRQNEMRARFVGYEVWRFKYAAFVMSAVFAGFAGGLFAMAQQSAYPDVMSVHQSGLIVMMTLVGGGLVSFWGPVLGVAVYFVTRDLLGAFTEGWLLWYGLMFMVLVMFRPEGLAGILHLARARIESMARPGVLNRSPAE
jgi:branched-chain amino acid transport system permease protein